jgi:hypothetical protein
MDYPTDHPGPDRLRSPLLLHEGTSELRNLIGCCIEREVPCIEDVESVRHVPVIRFGVERPET